MHVAVRSRFDYHETTIASKNDCISQLEIIRNAGQNGTTLAIAGNKLIEASTFYWVVCAVCELFGMKNPTSVHLVDREIIHQLRIASYTGYLKDEQVQSLVSEAAKHVRARTHQVHNGFSAALDSESTETTFHTLLQSLISENTRAFTPSRITSRKVRSIHNEQAPEFGDVYLCLAEQAVQNNRFRKGIEYLHSAEQTNLSKSAFGRHFSLLVTLIKKRDSLRVEERFQFSKYVRNLAAKIEDPNQKKLILFLSEAIYSITPSHSLRETEEKVKVGETLIQIGLPEHGMYLLEESGDKEAILRGHIAAAQAYEKQNPQRAFEHYQQGVTLLLETNGHYTSFHPWLANYATLAPRYGNSEQVKQQIEKMAYATFSKTQSSGPIRTHIFYEDRDNIARSKQKEIELALQYINLAIATSPQTAEYHFLKGVLCDAKQYYDPSVDENVPRIHYRKAHQLDSTDPYYFLLSVDDNNLGKYSGPEISGGLQTEIFNWYRSYRMIDQSIAVYKRAPKPVFDKPLGFRYS